MPESPRFCAHCFPRHNTILSTGKNMLLYSRIYAGTVREAWNDLIVLT